MSYHSFKDAEGMPYGSFETFYVPENDGAQPLEPGWYWWPCFPGCLPDGEPVGPFETEQAAIDNAREVLK